MKLSKLRRLCFRRTSQWCHHIGFWSITFIACLYIETIGFNVVEEACDRDIMQYDKCENIIGRMYSFAVWHDRSLLIIQKQLRFGLTFLQIFLTWLLHFKFLSRMMARYLTSFTTSITSFLILTSNTSLAGLFRMEKHVETVFLTLRVKWDNSSHLEIFCNACVF